MKGKCKCGHAYSQHEITGCQANLADGRPCPCMRDQYFFEDNTNCLEGIRCPKCGSPGSFNIAVRKTVRMADDGEDWMNDKGSDIEWEDDSYIECCECHHHGTVAEFSAKGGKLDE